MTTTFFSTVGSYDCFSHTFFGIYVVMYSLSVNAAGLGWQKIERCFASSCSHARHHKRFRPYWNDDLVSGVARRDDASVDLRVLLHPASLAVACDGSHLRQ